MAILDPSGINPGQLVQYIHVRNLYDALNGDGTYDIIVTGDLTVNSGAIYGSSISGSSFTGSGLSLTGVITDAESASFTTTSSFNTFTSSYEVASASFASRIVSNDNDITNLFVASQSLNTQQNALQSWSSSIVLDYLGDVQTVGAGYVPLNGNVLVYDSSVSKFRPSRNSVTVNITGSTNIQGQTNITGNTFITGDTELIGDLTADRALFSEAITASNDISSSAKVQGLTGSFGRLEGLSPITVGDELILLSNITSSANISASLDVFGRTGSFNYLDLNNISSLTSDLNIDGNITASQDISASGDLHGNNLILTAGGISTVAGTTPIDFSTTALTGITSLTASSDISASGNVSGVTGSFSHLTGNSPITVGSPTKFLQSVTASVISASGDIQGGSLTSAGTITAGVGSFVITDNLRAHPGDVIAVLDNLNVTGNVTASQDISASGDLHGAGLIVEGTGRITGSLFVSGSSNSVDLIPEDRFLVDSDNIILSSSINFGILGSPVLDGNLTASGAVSASSKVYGSALYSAGAFFSANTQSMRNSSNQLQVAGAQQWDGVTLGRAGKNMELRGILTSDLTASSTVAISGANAINADRFTADTYVQTPRIDSSGGVLTITPNSTVVTTLTASSNISSSATVFGETGSFSHLVGNSPITFGDSITLLQSVTASGTAVISGSLRVSATTGSFSHWEGNSPITVADPTEFLQSVTASVISASSAIVAPGIDIAITEGSSADSNLYGVNGRKVTMKNQLQSTLADGAFATFTLLNTDIEAGSIVLGAFTGNTTQSLSVGSIISVTTIGALTASVQIHNETGQAIPDDTGFTASFVIM